MDFFDKILSRIGYVKSALVFPTVTGGFDIFRNFLDADTWGATKRLQTYRKSLYVFACVYKIAQKTASIDWELFKLSSTSGDKVEVASHPVIDLLYRPNQFQTKEEFFQKYMINKKLTGEAFILKVRNPAGDVVELWNLRPDYMRVILDAQEGIKAYEFSGGAKLVTFKPEDIIHDSYPDSMSEFGGMSPILPAAARIDIEDYATQYNRNFFINNARPDFLVLADKKITAEQKEQIKGSWEKRHKAGEDQKNVGKGAFLEGGLQYQQVSISQADMDYIEGLKSTRDDILTAFGVPKPIVAITDDVNLANAETALQVFLSETIVPEIRALTNKLNEHLVYEEFDPLLTLEFDDPVPENGKQKAEVQGMRISAGTMLINEAREEWGMDPIAGGNSLYLPFGLQPVGGITAAEAAEKKTREYVPRGKASRAFRGRRKAYRILEEKEKIMEVIYQGTGKALAEDFIRKEGRKDTISMIKPEVRKAYGDVTNVAIDKKADAFKPVLDNFFAEQRDRAVKALKLKDAKAHTKVTGDEVAKRLEKWANEEAGVAAEFVFPFIAEFLKEAGQDGMKLVAPQETFDAATKRIQAYLKARAKSFGGETTVTTMDKLAKTLGEGIAGGEGVGQLINRIDSVYADFPLSRSLMIARTEATSANNKGFIESYAQSGVANAKEWIATSDDRTRDSHIAVDGEVVSLDDSFQNGLMFPGDPKGDPEETINCRCVLGPAFRE